MKLIFLPDKLLHILINTSSQKRFLLLGGMGAVIFGIPLGIFASLSFPHSDSFVASPLGDDAGLAVLAAETEDPNFVFNVNVPSFFSEDVTITGGLTVQGKAVFADGVDLSGNDIDLGEGELTASNVIYSITAGDGITITDGQEPTVTNSGVLSLQGKTGALSLEAGSGISIDGLKITATGSDQDVFKTISVSGQDDITAGSSTDTLTFAAGSGITVTTDSSNKIVTITSSGGGSSGVTSVNSLTGGLTIANTTGSGSTITIDDASTTAKGIAQFSSTDFSVTSGLVSLVQSIATSASPSFVGMTLSGLTTNGGLLYTNGSGALAQLSAGTSGYVLSSNGAGSAPSWIATSSLGYWQRSLGAISPINITDDLLLGSTASSSALVKLGGTSGASSYFNTGGNVGIGTSNPTYKFEVSGQFSIGSGVAGGAALYSNSSNTLTLQSTNSQLFMTSNNIELNANSTGYLDLRTAYTSRIRVANSGNIGIGTTSPGQKLDVNGNIRSSDGTFVAQIKGDSGGPRITFGDTSDPASMFSIGAYGGDNTIDTVGRNLRIFSTSDTTGLTFLHSSGNFGIGSTTPNEKLDINGRIYLGDTSAPGTTTNRMYSVSGNLYWNGTQITGSGGGLSQWTTSGSNIYYSSGNVGVGNVGTPIYTLDVRPTASFRDIFRLQNNAGRSIFTVDSFGIFSIDQNSSTTGDLISLGKGSGASSSNYVVINTGSTNSGNLFNVQKGGNSKFLINTNGYLGLGTTAPVALFDVSGAVPGKALAILNQTGDQDIFTASTSGATKFVISNTGNVGIGVSAPTAKLEVAGDIFPEADGTRNLGSASRHFDTIYVNNISGASTSSVGTVNSGTWQGSVITPQYGGTGLSSYTSGDILYASGTTTLSKLGVGSTGNCLTVSSSLPAWGTCGPWTASGSNAYLSGGNVGIGTTSTANKLTINGLTTADSSAAVALSTGATDKKGLVIQGYSSQGSNLQEWQSSAGVLLSSIDANGLFKVFDTSNVPSYLNTGGTGNRTSSISVTTTGCCWNNAPSEGVDGVTTAGSGFGFWEYGGGSSFTVSNDNITFDFSSAKVINEVTLYMYGPASTSQGTWKWQGSNNGSSWSDIGGTFSITTTGASSPITITTLAGNTSGYRYYRMQGVSGQFNGGASNNGQNHSFDEFQFKIAASTTSVNTVIANNYIDLGGSVAGTHALTISTAKTGKALVMFNETGNNDILTASSSGTTKFTINNSGQIYMADGSAPSSTTNKLYSVSGSLYWNGTAIATGTGSQWTTSSSDIYYNTGNVAIGTTSTSSRLDLKSSAVNTDVQRWVAADGSRLGRFTETSGGAGWFEVDNASGTAQALLRGDGGDSYLLTGNFGIGTSTPGSRLDLVSANTTTNGFNLTASSLTTGYGAYFSSTSTGLTTGSLLGLDWSPGSSTTATGDLLSLNVGSNGSLGNIFNVKNGGSSVFSVSQTAVTASLPVNFTSPGDVSFAYDLVFTNPTASYITSAAPLYLRAGEIYNSSDLTLATYNKGNVIADSEAFVARSATSSGQLVVGTSTAPANIGNLYVTNSSTFGKALAIFNQTESADIFTASNSGTTRFVLAASGNIGINTTSTANPITVGTDNTNGNGANLSAGGSWNNGSSREFKENISDLDYDTVLSKINQLTINEWNYKNEEDTVKHIGPLAEEFYSLFGVGNDNKHISTIDPAGIALAGIKALSKQLDDLRMQTLLASPSAHIASSSSLGLTEENATISGDLTVLGRSTLSDLGVTGKIVSGLMSIDGAKGSINVLGDLKLQENGFGKVDLFAGKMIVDNKGNLKTEGTVTAKRVETEAVKVLGSSTGDEDTIGKEIVKSGTTSIVISTGAVKNTSKIFVTPRSKTGNRQLVVTQVVNGTSFKVEIENAYTSDISFDWWVIN